MTYVYVAWPACRYGPEGKWAIFEKPEDVPAGWHAAEDRHLIIEPGAALPEDGPDAHGGLYKADMIAMLRKADQKIHANMTPRNMHAKLVMLGLITVPKAEEKPSDTE
jgi:hypothetical protein